MTTSITLRTTIIAGLLGCMSLTPVYAQTFYKWTDAQGATHYSQQPQYNVKNVQTVTVYKDPESLNSALGRLRSDGCQILRIMLPRAQEHMDEYNYSQRARVERAQRAYDQNCD